MPLDSPPRSFRSRRRGNSASLLFRIDARRRQSSEACSTYTFHPLAWRLHAIRQGSFACQTQAHPLECSRERAGGQWNEVLRGLKKNFFRRVRLDSPNRSFGQNCPAGGSFRDSKEFPRLPVSAASWTHRWIWVFAVGFLVTVFQGTPQSYASGPLVDPLDGQPLKWKLSEADGPVEIRGHWVDGQGGIDQRPCEALTLVIGNATSVLLEYLIEPSIDFDEVRATLGVQAVHDGPQIMLRVRYPRLIDPATRQPVIAYIRGQRHSGRSAWQYLSVQPDASERHAREMGLRARFGSRADLRDAYLDAVVLNVSSRAGAATIRLDNLRVDGLIGQQVVADIHPRRDVESGDQHPVFKTIRQESTRSDTLPQDPFPAGQIARLVEYRGEPLAFLKMLGFTGILLEKTPTEAILREALSEGLNVYSPPPMAIDEKNEPYLSAVAGWYLGTSVDETQLDFVSRQVQRVRSFPPLWKRPLFIAPAEGWERFASLSTSIIYDLPLSIRGLDGHEETRLLLDQARSTGVPTAAGVAVMTEPPQRLVFQLDALSQALGAPAVEEYGWRSTLVQVARSLILAPRAIIFRSTSPLTSGRPVDATRGAAVALANRWVELVSPLVSSAAPGELLQSNRDDYSVVRLAVGASALLVATDSRAHFGASVGDRENRSLQIQLPPQEHPFLWRITHGVVQQLAVEGQYAGRSVVISDPDCVEWIVSSDDPTVGGQLDRRLRPGTPFLCQQRWTLVSQDLLRIREDWRAASAGGILPRSAVPSSALTLAANTLSSVQRSLAAGDVGSAMRACATGDRLASECETLLANRLLPKGSYPTGTPTLLAPGGRVLQIAWLPSLEEGRWQGQLLTGGDFDQPRLIEESGWSYESRLEKLAEGTVGIDAAAGENGSGALRIETVGRGLTPMPGGYAGTVVRVRSAPVSFPVGSWVRIDARLKTLGFGGANQGLLLYDSDAGSELGCLIRNQPLWTTVRLFRLVTSDRPFRIVLEGIGSGEAVIDWVDVAMWHPPQPEPFFRPMDPRR